MLTGGSPYAPGIRGAKIWPVGGVTSSATSLKNKSNPTGTFSRCDSTQGPLGTNVTDLLR